MGWYSVVAQRENKYDIGLRDCGVWLCYWHRGNAEAGGSKVQSGEKGGRCLVFLSGTGTAKMVRWKRGVRVILGNDENCDLLMLV